MNESKLKNIDNVNVKNINIYEFAKEFGKEYNFLYEHNDNVAGYEEAANAFDDFLFRHKNFVVEFVNYRGDFISSDREAAAFMFAIEKYL